VDVFASFFQVLHSVSVRRGSEDGLWWVSSKKCLFKVGSFFSSLDNLRKRAAFFAWLAALGKILTLDNLRKRRVILMDRCRMCKRNGESMDHLLLHYDMAYALWSALFTRFGMS
jgi:hypothetical protein